MPDPTDVMWFQWALGIAQVLTLVALVVTVVLTWKTAAASRMAAEAAAASVEESRLARKESSDPRLAVYFGSPVGSVAEIVIENYGEATATNISFEFDPPLETSQHREAVVRFFDSPKTLQPHGTLRHAFDTWPEYFQADLPRRYNVRVAYQRLGESELRSETHVLDAGAFEFYSTWQVKGVHELTSRFERLADTAERWINQDLNERRSDTRRHDLLAEARSLPESMSDLLATVELLEVAGDDESARMMPGLYLPSLRRHSLTSFLAARREGAEPRIGIALRELTLALYHRDWHVLNQTAARARLESAIVQLREAWEATTPSV